MGSGGVSKAVIGTGHESRSLATAAPEGDGLGMKPLYRQVRDTLIRRMVDGVWAPGEPLPSEMQLAAELGVSQGTVRTGSAKPRVSCTRAAVCWART